MDAVALYAILNIFGRVFLTVEIFTCSNSVQYQFLNTLSKVNNTITWLVTIVCNVLRNYRVLHCIENFTVIMNSNILRIFS